MLLYIAIMNVIVSTHRYGYAHSAHECRNTSYLNRFLSTLSKQFSVSDTTERVREKIKNIAKDRCGPEAGFHLYPYLERGNSLLRQQIFSNFLASKKSLRIMEIGGYYNDISKFLSHCPEFVVVIEPVLDTGVHFKECRCGRSFPVFTFSMVAAEIVRHFPGKFLNLLDAIVCIGCDATWGPSPLLFNHSRNADLLIEFPTDYGPSVKTFDRLRPDVLFDQNVYIDAGNFKLRRMILYGTSQAISAVEERQAQLSFRLPSPSSCTARHTVSQVADYREQAALAEELFEGVRPRNHLNVCATDPALLLSKYFRSERSSDLSRLFKVWTHDKIRSCPLNFTAKCSFDIPVLDCATWVQILKSSFISHGHKMTYCRSNFVNLLDDFIARCASEMALNQLVVAHSLSLSLNHCSMDPSSDRWDKFHVLLAKFSPRSICSFHQNAVPTLFYFHTPAPGMPIPPSMISMLEPLCVNGRNMMFELTGALIEFSPYIVLPYFFQKSDGHMIEVMRKAVLWDIGSNGFYASTKTLIDMYSPYLNFSTIYIAEPDPVDIPKAYSEKYNIKLLQKRFHQRGNSSGDVMDLDVSTLVDTTAGSEFVVIKLDIDDGSNGATVEWGLLVDILNALSEHKLYIELFVELHMYAPEIRWYHEKHSMWEAFDFLRQLRTQGYAVHAWP
jgi:hypothetical protein